MTIAAHLPQTKNPPHSQPRHPRLLRQTRLKRALTALYTETSCAHENVPPLPHATTRSPRAMTQNACGRGRVRVFNSATQNHRPPRVFTYVSPPRSSVRCRISVVSTSVPCRFYVGLVSV